MDSKHTSGTWNAYQKQSDGAVPIVAEAGGCPDAVIAVVGYDCPERCVSANAALISAAPELLTACEVLLSAEFGPDYMTHPQTQGDTMWGRARAAIAKARA